MTFEENVKPDSSHHRDGESLIRSFGRRRGRKLSQRKASLLTSALDSLALDLNQPLESSELASLFSGPVEEIWLEIGFGGGEHLIWQAEHNPHIGLIGAEPYMNGVAATISSMEARQLQGRIRLHADDVHPLLGWLVPASLSRAFMLFPDPWPKLRHRGRRLFSPALLTTMALLLKPGAQFRFASDIADYAESAIAHAKAHPDFEVADVFTLPARAGLTDWPVTRYEKKAAKAGRSSSFIVLIRRPFVR